MFIASAPDVFQVRDIDSRSPKIFKSYFKIKNRRSKVYF